MLKKSVNFYFRIPVWVYMLLVAGFPILYTVNLSFRKFSFALPGYEGQFIGLDNYTRALLDPNFWGSLGVTFTIILFVIPAQLVAGFFIAGLLAKNLRGTKIFSSFIFLPMTIAPIVVGLIGRLLLIDRFGLVSWYLEYLGIDLGGSILGQRIPALASIIILDIWHWTPYVALLLLAGLQSLPVEPYEAIELEGASKLQTVWYVTLPLLKPILVTAVLFRSIDLFRIFDEILVLTGGGPGSSTESVEMLTYKVNFHNWDMGYGASIGVITLIMVLLMSLLSLKVTRKET
ncbi:carbohydrate ABC transporter permease [Paenibacillus elgii]